MQSINRYKTYIFYRIVPIFVLFILLVFALFFISPFYSSEYLLAQQAASSFPENITSFALNNITEHQNKPVVSVNTDKLKYAPGQVIRVLGNVSNENGTTTDTNVLLETRKTHNISPKNPLWPFDFTYVAENNPSLLHRAFLLTKNGSYSDPIMNLGSGKYNVTANASLNGDNLTDWTTFEVIDWMTSMIFFMLVVTLVVVVFLIIAILRFNEKRSPTFETIRFILLSLIALLPLTAFF
jgi:hypothetical protein